MRCSPWMIVPASVALASGTAPVAAQDVTIRLLASEPTITLGEDFTLLAVYESVGVTPTGLAEIDLRLTNSLPSGTEVVAARFPGGWANARELVRTDQAGGFNRVWGLRFSPFFGSDLAPPPLTAFEFDARVIAPGVQTFTALASDEHDFGGVMVYNGDTTETVAEAPDTLAFIDASVSVVSPCGTGTIYDLSWSPLLSVRTDDQGGLEYQFFAGLGCSDPFLRADLPVSLVDLGGVPGPFVFAAAGDLGDFVRQHLPSPGWAVAVDDAAFGAAQQFETVLSPEPGLAAGVEGLMRPFSVSEPSGGTSTSEIPLIRWPAVPPPSGYSGWESGKIRVEDASGFVVEAEFDPGTVSYQVQSPLAPGEATATVTLGVTDPDGLGVAVAGPCSATGETVLGRSEGVAAVEILSVASVSFTVELGTPCNPADIAAPFGVLDLADLSVFLTGFSAQDPIADLNQDGLFDLGDVTVVIQGFLAGCP